MMISPECFLERHSQDSYEELITVREELIDVIRQFELEESLEEGFFELEGIPEKGFIISPGPDVVYQMNLKYLSVLCNRIAEVYNKDIVWGDEADE